MMSADQILLEVRGLTVDYRDHGRTLRVIEHLDLDVRVGETLAIVGESGCGKTTLGRAMLRLVEPSAGSLRFDGREFRSMKGAALRAIRREMQMVFQNPFASLNPRMCIEDLVAEPIRTHERLGKPALRERIVALLQEVGLDADSLPRYPHQLSGGQAQR